MKIATVKLKQIIKEEIEYVLQEKEKELAAAETGEEGQLKTVGDLRKALRKIQIAKQAGGLGEIAKDLAIGAVLDAIPGASTAKSLWDIVKSVHDPTGKTPKKKTGSPLDKLQIDPEISKIVDDTVEDNFLKVVGGNFEDLDDNTPIDNINMTNLLQKYIADAYEGRSVSKPNI